LDRLPELGNWRQGVEGGYIGQEGLKGGLGIKEYCFPEKEPKRGPRRGWGWQLARGGLESYGQSTNIYKIT
jgi:hypothetical protein